MSNVQAHTEAMQSLEQVQKDLWILANAFQATGNATLGNKLREAVFSLEEIQKTCENIFSSQLNSRYQDAVQSSSTILATALAVTKMKGTPE